MKLPNFDTVENSVYVGKFSALVTFLLGTSLLILYYFYNHSSVIFFSLFFIVIAVFVNGYCFIKLLSYWLADVMNRNSTRNAMLLMLLNIPIAYVYVKIGLEIYNSSFTIH